MNAFQELDSLQQTLNDALNTFREELKAANLPPLSLVSAERHPLDDYSYLASPRLYEARRVAIGKSELAHTSSLSQRLAQQVWYDVIQSLHFCGVALGLNLMQGQLKSLIQNPFEKAYEGALSAYSRAALEVMVETGLSDYLGSVADSAKGAPVPDIQKALDMDSRRLIMVLRLLATDGWVRETSEGVFALNRPGLELLSDRQGYNVMRSAARCPVYARLRLTLLLRRVAAVGLFANQLVGWLQHPQWKYSDAVNETPVQMAYKTRLPLFQWLNEHPEAFARMTKGIKVRFLCQWASRSTLEAHAQLILGVWKRVFRPHLVRLPLGRAQGKDDHRLRWRTRVLTNPACQEISILAVYRAGPVGGCGVDANTNR